MLGRAGRLLWALGPRLPGISPAASVMLTQTQDRGIFSSAPLYRQQIGAGDDPLSGPLEDRLVFPDLEELRKVHPELAQIIAADEKMRRESSMNRVMEIIRKRHSDVENSTSQSLLSYLRTDELQAELVKCGIAAPPEATRQATLAMLGAFLELEPINDDDSMSEDFQRIEEEAARSSLHPVPMSRKFDFADAITPETAGDVLVGAHGIDVCVIDVTAVSRITNYFVIATGRSKRHLHALASALLYKLKEQMEAQHITEVTPGLLPDIEGQMGDEWLVVDAGSVVAHLFLESERKYYNLEGLWGKTDNVKWLESHSSIETLETIRVPP